MPLALRSFVDATGTSAWGQLFAMSVLAILPIFLVFLFFQRLIIEGVAHVGDETMSKATKPPLNFAAIGLNHSHIYGQTKALLDAGAELVAVHAVEDDLAAAYMQALPAGPARRRPARDPRRHLASS